MLKTDVTIMKYNLAFFAITLTSLSCEPDYNDYPLVPFAAEYEPVSFIESGGSERPVLDCNTDFGEFSAELKEFVLGNFTIGDTLDSDCSQCGKFSGLYTWQSRCSASYRSKGRWSCHEYGETLFFKPDSSPDSTLAFKALMSPSNNVWKLRYEKGDAFLEVWYKAKRD
jgi:hypothetical protein